MSAPNVACELMMGWWGVGFGGGARRPTMRVMQSSPFVQRMVKVGCAPAVCGVPTGSCQGMCVGAWFDGWQDGAGTGRRGEVRRRRRELMEVRERVRRIEKTGLDR